MEANIRHLGIIMDGNRRWARARGLPPREGHRAGMRKLEEVLAWCRDARIGILTVYAFSTENWNRSAREVGFLMRLFHHAFTQELAKLSGNNVRVRVIGRMDGLPESLRGAIAHCEERTKENTGIMLNLAINYGGRAELTDAFRELLKHPSEQVSEETIARYLYTAGVPDPDLIIRTSGEHRLSGFLLWQGAYAELLFIDSHWPEFSKQDFEAALSEFARRQRRFGQ